MIFLRVKRSHSEVAPSLLYVKRTHQIENNENSTMNGSQADTVNTGVSVFSEVHTEDIDYSVATCETRSVTHLRAIASPSHKRVRRFVVGDAPRSTSQPIAVVGLDLTNGSPSELSEEVLYKLSGVTTV
eukprot:GHVN01082953.1.p1 GENE.GHVN01082953.1~~GHVN01082953.1.p1  ORF type:complete len:129 (+),score=6.67 GHVN01082953.1:19-405(+)